MLTFYGHPISSFTWKALIALYENETPFDFITVDQTTFAAAIIWAAGGPYSAHGCDQAHV